MQTISRGITYTDLMHRGRPRVIATAVVQGAAGVALVDPGPTSCLETLRTALTAAGIAIADVRALLLTHIHLDHAGATGSLLRENPDIAVYVHERGAPHMIDPSKLLASAARLYGDEMDELWGAFLPVPEANVRVLGGGERIEAADRKFDVAYTPGHASHHVSFLDRDSGIAFVGDVAGVRTGRELFVLPPTPPPDIDVEVWAQSIELVRQWRASTLLVTHFGAHEDPDKHLDAMQTHLTTMTDIARECISDGGNASEQQSRFVDEMRVYIERHVPAAEAGLYGTAAPLDQCFLGLARYWRKRGVTGE
jgi:glyoxylase-like metal-dependent hydrolase (beta-lactamase superfamily II)